MQQRYQDMKQLHKDPNAASKARAAEQRANEEAGLKSLKLEPIASKSSSTGKKKPVFKSTLQPQNAAPVVTSIEPAAESDRVDEDDDDEDLSNAKENGWWEARYRPDVITACEVLCQEDCPDCHGREIVLGA